jgi:hypothetical protein
MRISCELRLGVCCKAREKKRKKNQTNSTPLAGMMEQQVKALQTTDPTTQVSALREIKNSIIGSQVKKQLFANAGVIEMYLSVSFSFFLRQSLQIPCRILQIVAQRQITDTVLIQCCGALGSFAYGDIFFFFFFPFFFLPPQSPNLIAFNSKELTPFEQELQAPTLQRF